ncbi:MAG: DeoR family transcriptional regulator [Patescibacteria group bacterium]
MIPRQKELFKNIVQEYVKTAQPVGSNLLVEKFKLDISPATVRNDMRELEEQNLIIAPHTSAGRVPTEYGYKYFVKNYIDLGAELNKKEAKEVQMVYKNEIKNLAKIISEKSGLGVFLGFAENDVYYTGLSNIFSQPEFQNLDLIYNISSVIDHLDEVMEKMYNQITEKEIKIGNDNLFSSDCSAILYKIKNVLIGILGPMRMDYQYNIKLLNCIKNII